MKNDKNSHKITPSGTTAQPEQTVPDNRQESPVPQFCEAITFAQWFKKYRPMVNRIAPPPPAKFLRFTGIKVPKKWPRKSGFFNGRLFWMKGAEFRFVLKQPLNKIWTLIDEGNHCFVHAGFHRGSELGYFVTHVAAPANRIFHILAD
jgi:hypothetical protein